MQVICEPQFVYVQMGGRTSVEEEVLCQFTFPERAGALMNFLDSFSPRWNIFINIITHIVLGFSFVGDIDTSAPFESVRERIFARRPKISLLYASQSSY